MSCGIAFLVDSFARRLCLSLGLVGASRTFRYATMCVYLLLMLPYLPCYELLHLPLCHYLPSILATAPAILSRTSKVLSFVRSIGALPIWAICSQILAAVLLLGMPCQTARPAGYLSSAVRRPAVTIDTERWRVFEFITVILTAVQIRAGTVLGVAIELFGSFINWGEF